MTDYLPASTVLQLIRYVDEINLKHGATPSLTNPLTDEVKEIERRAYAAGLKLLRAQVRHLGTEQNLQILKSIYEYLRTHIDMMFKTEVSDILTETVDGTNHVKGVQLKMERCYMPVVSSLLLDVMGQLGYRTY